MGWSKYSEDNREMSTERLYYKASENESKLGKANTYISKDKPNSYYKVNDECYCIELFVYRWLSADAIAYLKGNHWRWNYKLKCWTNYYSISNETIAMIYSNNALLTTFSLKLKEKTYGTH